MSSPNSFSIAIVLLLSFTSIPTVLSQLYTMNTKFQGNDFFEGFNWETMNDPTNGRVNYVDQGTAQSTNLSSVSGASFFMKADSYQMVAPSSRGRNSVRITSHQSWADSVFILDLAHMPAGCATWPAYWSVSQSGPWPDGGEHDIIEGVNINTNNLASLHTTPNCTMSLNRAQTGSVISTNCDSSFNNNQGCGVASNTPKSYGSAFNDNGGGWFATWRSPNGIHNWFWPRDSASVPNEIRQDNYSGPITPGQDWGAPDSTFTFENCDYSSHFNSHQIIFDLTFCGDWAGNAFATAGCGPESCQDFVDNNPSAFEQAYWEIYELRIYTPCS